MDQQVTQTAAPTDGPWNWDWTKLAKEAGNASAALAQGVVNSVQNTPKMPWEMDANELSQQAGNTRQIDPTYQPRAQPQPQPDVPTLSPTGLFARLINTESGGKQLDSNGNLLTSSKGAQGISQLMPATAGNPGYGVTPIQNQSPEEYLRFGRDYLGAMINHFGGDQAKGVAAYNAGPGAIEKAVAKADKLGGDWKQYIPTETRKYVQRIVGA